jgi:hypothetical protein
MAGRTGVWLWTGEAVVVGTSTAYDRIEGRAMRWMKARTGREGQLGGSQAEKEMRGRTHGSSRGGDGPGDRAAGGEPGGGPGDSVAEDRHGVRGGGGSGV